MPGVRWGQVFGKEKTCQPSNFLPFSVLLPSALSLLFSGGDKLIQTA